MDVKAVKAARFRLTRWYRYHGVWLIGAHGAILVLAYSSVRWFVYLEAFIYPFSGLFVDMQSLTSTLHTTGSLVVALLPLTLTTVSGNV